MRTWPALLVENRTAGKTQTRSGFQFLHSENQTRSGFSDLVQAALVDFDVTAIDEPSPDSLRAFFHDAAERDRALTELTPAFPDLAFAPVDIEDEDWAARSQAHLTAIHVDRIVVTPPWTPEATNRIPGVTTVVIQPSMGFGTGHHATTRLCLAALQRSNPRGRSVIDVGTGSGVLAIAASLLGATPAIGLDDDADAIQSARENLELNPDARVDLRVGDLRTSVPGVADIVLANLTGTLLVQAASQLEALVAPAGRLILSGLLDHEEPAVTGAFPALSVLDRAQEDEWVCLQLARPGVFE